METCKFDTTYRGILCCEFPWCVKEDEDAELPATSTTKDAQLR